MKKLYEETFRSLGPTAEESEAMETVLCQKLARAKPHRSKLLWRVAIAAAVIVLLGVGVVTAGEWIRSNNITTYTDHEQLARELPENGPYTIMDVCHLDLENVDVAQELEGQREMIERAFQRLSEKEVVISDTTSENGIWRRRMEAEKGGYTQSYFQGDSAAALCELQSYISMDYSYLEDSCSIAEEGLAFLSITEDDAGYLSVEIGGAYMTPSGGLLTADCVYHPTSSAYGDEHILSEDFGFSAQVTTLDGVVFNVFGSDGGRIWAMVSYPHGGIYFCGFGCTRAEVEEQIRHLDLTGLPEVLCIGWVDEYRSNQ